MHRVMITVPICLPGLFYGLLRLLMQKLISADVKLLGDRDVEWSWISAHIPSGP
jgi:hypothetical protein